MECILCTGGKEGRFHLLFECSFARKMWARQPISRGDVSSAEAFWASLQGGVSGRPVEQGQLLEMIWEIWLHYKEVIVRECIVHDVESLISLLFRGT